MLTTQEILVRINIILKHLDELHQIGFLATSAHINITQILSEEKVYLIENQKKEVA